MKRIIATIILVITGQFVLFLSSCLLVGILTFGQGGFLTAFSGWFVLNAIIWAICALTK
jgi:hypothetical protein